MSRLGFGLWSPNSEMFVMGVVGMCISAAEAPLRTITSDMKEVWNMELPAEKFSVGLQYLLRLILISVISTRCVTVYGYIISSLLTPWPIFLDEQEWMLLPWLVIGGIKNIVTELVVLLTGSFIFMRYGSPFNLICLEFLIIKGVTLAFSTYLWVSHLFLYKDLTDPPIIFKWEDNSANKRMEIAMRRRMCKSICTQVVWKRRMLEEIESHYTAHATVSLDEELFKEGGKASLRLPRSRSLDNLLDKLELDWDMLDDMTARRSFEKIGNQTLSSKARKFLDITKLDIEEAKMRKKKLQGGNDKATQTNTLSKKFLDSFGSKNLNFLDQDDSIYTPRQSQDMSEEPIRSPISPLNQKFSPVTLKPEMAGRYPETTDTQNNPVQNRLRHLNISMPPRYGYRHATTQVNNISRKYLEEMSQEQSHPVEECIQPVTIVVTPPKEETTERSKASFVAETELERTNNDQKQNDTYKTPNSEAKSRLMESKNLGLKKAVESRRKPFWENPHEVKTILGYSPDPSIQSLNERDGNDLKTLLGYSPNPSVQGVNSLNEKDDKERKRLDSFSNAPIPIQKERSKDKMQSSASQVSTFVAKTEPKPARNDQDEDSDSMELSAHSMETKILGSKKSSGPRRSTVPFLENPRDVDTLLGNSPHPSFRERNSLAPKYERKDEKSTENVNAHASGSVPGLLKETKTDKTKEKSREVNSKANKSSVMVTDDAIPGTSKESDPGKETSSQVNFNPTVNNVTYIKNDLPFGRVPEKLRIDEDSKSSSGSPFMAKTEASGTSSEKPSKLEFRPSIRTIKRYANQGQFKQAFAANSYVSKPVEFTPQQTTLPSVQDKAGTLHSKTEPVEFTPPQTTVPSVQDNARTSYSKTKKKSGKVTNEGASISDNTAESQSYTLSITSNPSFVSSTSTNHSISTVDSLEMPHRVLEREDDESAIDRALALNEEKLADATQKHERQRSCLILQQLETDEDFALARPQGSLDPVRRASSGSLRAFLAYKEDEESDPKDEDS